MNQPKGVKPKLRGRKVKSGVYWQGTLKTKDVNPTGIKRP